MRRTAVVAACAVALSASLASAADTERIVKYYRKKPGVMVPANAKVTVTGLAPSTRIKGAKEGVLEIGEGPAARKVPFVASADERYVVFGTVEDVTTDPAKAVMEKINLKGEPFKGPADAKVTIVEYSDFQCPFCGRGYQTMENQVLKDYGDKVRFYYKNYPLPFHPWAEPAAVAAECAKEQNAAAFWKLYNGFFQNQAQINPQNVKDKATEFLKDSGIDMAKWTDCFDNKKSLPKVKAEMAEGSSVGVTGTPGFIINGRLVSGAQPYENFKTVIDDELASAKK